MSFSNFTPRNTPDRSHMEKVSTFTQKFPVDTDNDEIHFGVNFGLPDSIGMGLLAQGCNKITSSVLVGGGIGLFPATATVRLMEANDEAETDLLKAQGVFSGLTEHQSLSLAHYEVTSENGFYTEFKIALIDQFGACKKVYELVGTSEDSPIGELNRYYLSTYDHETSEAGSYFEIGEELAGSILDALISQQQQLVQPHPGSLQAKLQQVIDASQIRAEVSMGKYLLEGNPEMSFTLEKGEVISHGLARVSFYSIFLEEQAMTVIDGAQYDTPRALSLDYDQSAEPPYAAYVHASFIDPTNQVPPYARDQVFDGLAKAFRDNPKEFFRALSHAAARLTEI